MSKVIHIRHVPDDVHSVLVDSAAAQGLSSTKLVLCEREQVARRDAVVQKTRQMIRATQASTRGRAARTTILEALQEGRGE